VGSLKLGTNGYFTINALGYASEAKWRVETLFLHEAVPGHHMQIARAAEIEGLHPWRSQASFNIAYVEGWALYAEWLGTTSGSSRIRCSATAICRRSSSARRVSSSIPASMLSSGRATRRSPTWKRKAGVDREFAVSEVDRYFSNPTQALGYLLGYHKMRELRTKAEASLGSRFDAKDFHAVAIDNGSMPLVVLEQLVDDWIARGGGANTP
jgi:uncharacterized protein (DUF885 family)